MRPRLTEGHCYVSVSCVCVVTRFEGKLIGFDEYMNLVLDDAEEVETKKEVKRKPLGRILLKGDAITMILNAPKA